ncbi:MAG: RluA family pseudouridine synthase [Nitriliruptoraceae bacterium]
MSDGGAVLVVGPDEAGRRVDVVVAVLLGTSRSAAARRADAGAVTVDGRPVRRNRVLTIGERLAVAAPVSDEVTAPPVPPVRHRDEHLSILAKPPGLVVHAGTGHRGDTLVDALVAAGVPLAAGDDPERPGIVHRLDRDTSGLLLVAHTEEARVGLSAQLARHEVDRRYLALLAGVPPEPRGIVDAPIARHPSRRAAFAVVEGGRPARTRYRVLGTGSVATPDGPREVAAVVCGLETGRTHQVRVHLDAIGAPVAGDPVYGADRAVAAALGLDRPALHAARLALRHPVTGVDLVVDEPLPADLGAAGARAGREPPGTAPAP